MYFGSHLRSEGHTIRCLETWQQNNDRMIYTETSTRVLRLGHKSLIFLCGQSRFIKYIKIIKFAP
jgi:hypothetical protein